MLIKSCLFFSMSGNNYYQEDEIEKKLPLNETLEFKYLYSSLYKTIIWKLVHMDFVKYKWTTISYINFKTNKKKILMHSIWYDIAIEKENGKKTHDFVSGILSFKYFILCVLTLNPF